MNAIEQEVERRFLLLGLAAQKDVAWACKVVGASRPLYLKTLDAYARGGAAGIRELVISTKRHLRRWIEPRVRELLEANPGWGTQRITRTLRKEGFDVSMPTVRRILQALRRPKPAAVMKCSATHSCSESSGATPS